MKLRDREKSVFTHKNTATEFTSRIPGFYRLSVEQRLSHLVKTRYVTQREAEMLKIGDSLKPDRAIDIIENVVGVLNLPLGLALNFRINGRDYLIPMAVEEPSVVAAASKAALLIRRGGGFSADSDESVMIGQIQMVDIDDPDRAAMLIRENQQEILEFIDSTIPRMKMRGGGAVDIETRIIRPEDGSQPMLIIHLLVDVRESMGANTVNTVCEKTAPLIERLTGGRANMKIVSNLADRRLSRASFCLDIDLLEHNNICGSIVARRLVDASRWAEFDPHRAATHNKGIFNGITAAAIALGQDWRAIEAGGHAYAARDDQYRGLTTFQIEEDKLIGRIELPLQVGQFGGTCDLRSDVIAIRKILRIESVKEQSAVMAAVGLAQNFAACLALCTEGIQAGHMALHARSVAASAGIPSERIQEIASEMSRIGKVNVNVAEELYHRSSGGKNWNRGNNRLLSEATAPGKSILFGEHAVVYGYPAILATLNQGLKVTIRHDPEGPRFLHPRFSRAFSDLSADADFQQFGAAANLALEQHKLSDAPIEILVESDLVPGVGLGSSAAFSVAITRAFGKMTGNSSNGSNIRLIREQVHELETIFHHNPSGADAATILNNRAILFNKRSNEPVSYLNPERTMAGMVCVVDKPARTSEMVDLVASRRRYDRSLIDSILDDIGDTTVDAVLAIKEGNIPKLGSLMLRNHELLGKLGVSTSLLDDAVECLIDMGVAGAKVTGAGGGGAVVVLLPEDGADDIRESLSEIYPVNYSFWLKSR